MSTPSRPEPPNDAPSTVATVPKPTRPSYWSVRRELWENRSIVLAPLLVGVLVLIGLLIGTAGLPRRLHAAMALDAVQQRGVIEGPYDLAALLMIVAAFLVGAFYCLDALHGERRDRSILFWKSLPVSDLTTVLAKAAIPLLVLPALTFAVVLVIHTILLLPSLAVLLASGSGAASLWAGLPFFQNWLVLAYTLVVTALWHAPLYAWLLLVSAWARRVPILWAVLPPLAVGVFARIAFNTAAVCSLLCGRVIGWFGGTFPRCSPSTPLISAIAPGSLLIKPDLWVGLALAAAFLAAAVRLRRYRGPI